MYATADQLRDRYRSGPGGVDEFTLREDADLAAALTAASAEIDRWRPQGTLSADALVVLQGVCVALARMLLHQDQALSVEHPIVRDAKEARDWLRALAAGTIRLPGGASTVISPNAAGTRAMAFDEAWEVVYRQ